MPEHGCEVWIGLAIKYDKAGIDRDLVLTDAGNDGVGMAADPFCPFVHRHIVALAQQPCGGQAGNPGSNHRHLQSDTIPHQVYSIGLAHPAARSAGRCLT